ncbi:MAG: NAD(P)/FAD-dependent oxidoreductase [Lachnospiraceae bacterium]|nr:NAD(P)/FAD-dependent oxidoreductase [Lachnospiraceae bacterium]
MKRVIVIGAGPAGLTAAYELAVKNENFEIIVLEETEDIGGISKTVNYKGNRMDMGGHRFFSKIPEVNEWWDEIMPMQTSEAKDDAAMGRNAVESYLASVNSGSRENTEPDGYNKNSDPEQTDRVMLFRRRVSRILFDDKFYDYPISLSMATFKNMGFGNTIKVGFSYLISILHKRPEDNLENFYINRFGRKLYSMFFEYYTENIWGRHPREIDASWGGQRVKGLSIFAILRDVLGRTFDVRNRKVETSLIEEFKYPKFGPGQLWELVAAEIEKNGGKIIKGARAVRFGLRDKRIEDVVYIKDGQEVRLTADYVISSMPVRELIEGMNDVPAEPARIAAGLPYRDYMTLGVLVSKLKLKNITDMKTVSNIVPDCWIYIQDRRVRMGRMQIYNNWSPYMVEDLDNTVWLGLEYFVNEGDEYWNMSDNDFARMGISEMVRIGIIDRPEDVIDTHLERVKKAYPAYFDTYSEMNKLTEFLKTISNLYCVGRNGQHRYNNMDHSMMTSFEALKLILGGSTDQTALWNVNTEKEYHEER